MTKKHICYNGTNYSVTPLAEAGVLITEGAREVLIPCELIPWLVDRFLEIQNPGIKFPTPPILVNKHVPHH